MAKRNRITTSRKNERRIAEGLGSGEGTDYKPWLRIQDVPSQGLVSRVKGWKTGRVHHLMSQLELMYFYLAEWSPIVIDIREQFPLLPLERTQEIARELDIEHPRDPFSKEPIVMTTDFMLTVRSNYDREVWARTIKPTERLGKREIEKFRIEHRYYQEQGISWGIVTEEDIPMILARNIETIHDSYYLQSNDYVDQDTIDFVAPKLFEAFKYSSLPLSKEALEQDKLFGLKPGTSLYITKHMVATKRWIIDMVTESLQFTRQLNISLPQHFPKEEGGFLA